MSARFLIALGLLGASAPQAGDEPPLFPQLQTETFDGGRRIDILHVPLVAHAAPRAEDGGRTLMLLTRVGDAGEPATDRGPCDDTTPDATALYRLDYDRARPSLILLRDDLPADATNIDAFDVDGDGVDEVLIFRPGQMLVLGESGTEVLVEDEDLRRAEASLDEPWLQVVGVGTAKYYRPGSTPGWELVSQVELPIKASLGPDGFRVSSPAPVPLGRGADGALVFSTGAQPYGSQRLKVLLVRPENGEVEECWARLPTPEMLITQVPLLLAGDPVLLVTSMPAEDFGLFKAQELRLFPLKRDRSRSGRPPLAAFKTRANIITGARPRLLDVDRDGREDLVLIYWKGFDREHIVLDVYLQEEDGGFSESARTTTLKVKHADSSVSSYVFHDFDGDGRFDLMLVADGKLLIHRGSAKSVGGRKLLEKTPAYSAPLVITALENGGEVGGRDGVRRNQYHYHDLDLDGDGRSEVLLVGRDDDGKGFVSLVLFDYEDPP